MSVEKVELEINNKHACTGVVMSCEETGRTIASFWHEDDAEDTMFKVNDYDRLLKENTELKQKLFMMLGR